MAVKAISASGVPIVAAASPARVVSPHGTTGVEFILPPACTPVVVDDIDYAHLARRMVEIEATMQADDPPAAWRGGLPGTREIIAVLLEGNGIDKPVAYATPDPWPELDPWRKRQKKGVVHQFNLMVSVHWVCRHLVSHAAGIDQRQPLLRLLEWYEERLATVISGMDGRSAGGQNGAGVPKQPHTRLIYEWVDDSADGDVIDMLGLRSEWQHYRDSFERRAKKKLPIVDIVVRQQAQTVTFHYTGKRERTFPFKEIHRMVSRARKGVGTT